ncbi:hypothetical protein niasHT_003309 [Heterodera trifolii]|uniref:PAZ domain-containing protein n=1 Tax=Heterodera trifolii TaxID=157864 RepID=A0ABD2LYY0_9BILA
MVLVSLFCANLLSCSPKSLRDRFNHPDDRSNVLKELTGKKVRTTYKDRNGMNKTFFVGGITERGAAFIPAYGKLRSPYNINVAAYFYARHRIKLHHPYAHCVVERFSSGEDRFYPMELLEIVEDQDKGRWLGRLFMEIGDDDDDSTSIDSSLVLDNGRNECSQMW